MRRRAGRRAPGIAQERVFERSVPRDRVRVPRTRSGYCFATRALASASRGGDWIRRLAIVRELVDVRALLGLRERQQRLVWRRSTANKDGIAFWRSLATRDADLPLLLLAVAEVVPGDDGRLRDGRQSCAGRTTGGCRRKREKSLLAASLWTLAQEPDVDPARIPEATAAALRRHRRRDRDRLNGVGDQPPPSR